MARARYGGERGAGPLAAGLERPDLPPARGPVAARRAVGGCDHDPPDRHPPAREARELADPRPQRFADVPRDVSRLPVHGLTGDTGCVGLRTVRADLDAGARLSRA